MPVHVTSITRKPNFEAAEKIRTVLRFKYVVCKITLTTPYISLNRNVLFCVEPGLPHR